MKGMLEKERQFCLREKGVLVIVAMLFVWGFLQRIPVIISVQCCSVALIYIIVLIIDDEQAGFSFLMTMPVDAKTYVWGVNVFAWIVLALMWVTSRGLLVLYKIIFGSGPSGIAAILSSGYVYFFVAAILVSMFVPLMLKFGSKSLLVACSFSMLIMIGIVTAVVMSGSIATSVFDFILTLIDLPAGITAPICGIITVILVSIFIELGVKVMKNKEF